MIKLLALIGFSFFCSPAEQDSIGVETINGKTFVIHKVDEKETLFAISRRYGASVEEIRQYNSLSPQGGLEIGQILKIPYAARTTAKAQQGTTHKVEAKETLFSISRLYGVSTDELKQWNNLTDNALSVGQELIVKKKKTTTDQTVYQPVKQTTTSSQKGVHVVAEKETMYSISRQYNVSVDQIKKWNELQNNELKIGQSLIVAEPEKGAQVKKETATTSTGTPVSKETTVTVKAGDKPRVEEKNPKRKKKQSLQPANR
jgi:LysM repeat protein